VQRYYQRFCDRLATLGTVREINEGPLDFARRAGEELPAYRDQIHSITRLYIAMRYQQHTVAPRLSEFKQAVQQLL
jgi:hypothetical protein